MFKTYTTFFTFLWRYKWNYILFLFFAVIFSIAQNVQPYFYKLFIDAIDSGNYNSLYYLLFGYVGVRILASTLKLITGIFNDTLVIPSARDARTTVFKHIQDLDFAYHLSKSTGSLISVMKRGDGAFFSFYFTIHENLLNILLSFVVMIYFLVSINQNLVLIILATFFTTLILAGLLLQLNLKARKVFNDAEDDITGIIVDNLINFETVKLFAKENQEFGRLKNQFIVWTKALWKFTNTYRFIDITIGIIGNCGVFLVLFFSIQQLFAETISKGEFIMILGFVSNFYPKFFQFIYELKDLIKNHTDIENYFAILDEEVEMKDPKHPVEMTSARGDIVFKDIDFSYPAGKQDTIKNFNLHIREGQSIAFVGKSGVGKTTIIKLLMRFYDPDKGEILLDGVNIKKMTKDTLRSLMGVVPQDPILFDNTIFYNIAYGKDDVTKQEVEACAKMANLHDFILALPNGYETNVGERGVKLSGGQKQRLAIARMILSDPKIIIFDEATSQLDSESEKLIQDAFWKIRENKTTLIIAHRLSTIMKAEKIVVMEKGEIKEVGSHRELIHTKDSLYKRFWELQTQQGKETF